MSETHRIAEQLRRSVEGGAWHGPALGELLDGVSALDAAARAVPDAHSIWELVEHITAWQDVVRRRVEGEPARELAPEEDFPPVDGANEDAWRQARARLEASTARLRETISRLDDGRLDETIAESRDTVYDLLYGVVQHNLYHAGQIALLKKALEAEKTAS